VVKKIEKVIEKIPGLGPLLEELMNSIAVLVFTTLEVGHTFTFIFEPRLIWFSPTSNRSCQRQRNNSRLHLETSSRAMTKKKSSGAGLCTRLWVKLIETFNFRDPYASDPTHSFLSKDHFVS
jgi:Heterokaryon incompatibility protein Het-C